MKVNGLSSSKTFFWSKVMSHKWLLELLHFFSHPGSKLEYGLRYLHSNTLFPYLKYFLFLFFLLSVFIIFQFFRFFVHNDIMWTDLMCSHCIRRYSLAPICFYWTYSRTNFSRESSSFPFACGSCLQNIYRVHFYISLPSVYFCIWANHRNKEWFAAGKFSLKTNEM